VCFLPQFLEQKLVGSVLDLALNCCDDQLQPTFCSLATNRSALNNIATLSNTSLVSHLSPCILQLKNHIELYCRFSFSGNKSTRLSHKVFDAAFGFQEAPAAASNSFTARHLAHAHTKLQIYIYNFSMNPRFSGFVLQWVVQLELIQARN